MNYLGCTTFCVVLLGFGISLSGQNLVLNGSFETITKCPDDLQQFERNVAHWTNPTGGSTDLFATCATFEDVSTGANYQGKQEPKAGSNYVGCYFYGVDDYREYIQGTLSEPLIIDNSYYVQFYVSLGDESDMAVADIQLLLTDKAINKYDSRNIRLEKIPHKKIRYQLIDLTDQVIDDKENWVLLEQEFIATETITHFTIGNFQTNKDTQKKNQKFFTKIRKAYYFIDDISITALQPVPEKATSSSKKIIEPDTYKLDETYKFENLRFDFDRWEIQEQSLKELNELAHFLSDNESISILIEGHTDEKGSTSYNEELALKRVQSVRDFFIDKHIDTNRIKIKSYGETRPINTDGTREADKDNRRVEFTLSKR